MINCTFENGQQAKSPGLRHVTVCVIAYNDKGEILLVKRSEKYSRPNTWTIPGGFLDRDKTLTESALKELKEEAGVEGTLGPLFHINDFPYRPNEDRQNVDFVYLVHVESNTFSHDDEITHVAWFNKNNLPNEEEFAFDHHATILKFFEYQEEQFLLPLMGKL